MLMSLALLEHTAPLGRIHDVCIKDSVSEYTQRKNQVCLPLVLLHTHTQFFGTVGKHRGTTWALV